MNKTMKYTHTTVPTRLRPPNARIPVYNTSFQSSPVNIYQIKNLHLLLVFLFDLLEKQL